MLQPFLDSLQNPALSIALGELLAAPDPAALFHIDVYALADAKGIARREMLEAFLAGVNRGVFDLAWEFHCPHCGGVARESIRLQDAASVDHCTVCNIDFRNQLDETIEVFFNSSDAVRPVPAVVKQAYLEGMMHDITTDRMHTWKKPTTIRGIDCINNPLFRSLFESNTLPLDQSLEIKFATLLFTDIKGSTALYERLGDARAYLLVREHFNILFQAIEKNGGIPVKTIGDAVMGVFVSDGDALKAAIQAQRDLTAYYGRKEEDERISVKIGLHAGPAVVVTLNGRLDYFGTTVNMAARIQGLAEPGKILFSEQIFNNKANHKILKGYTDRVVRKKWPLKGLTGDYTLYSV